MSIVSCEAYLPSRSSTAASIAAVPRIHRLNSGLRVVVRTLPDAPVTSAHLWFDAGAADEQPSEAGAAHFVEHLLFKGTERRGIGAAAEEIEGLGGDLNAWTSWDETVLHATLASTHVEEPLDVIFDMARSSQFDPKEVERERQVIIEEMRSYESDPETVATERLQARLFGDHTYGRPVIGHEASVTSLSRDELVGFWRRHYHPERALLAVAGPVAESEVLEHAHVLSADWVAGPARAPISKVQPRPSGAERVDRKFEALVTVMGWPLPGIGHADEAALDVLAFGLGEGAAARLTVLLDLDHSVANHVWADASHWLGGGMFSLGFAGRDTAKAIALTWAELERVARYGLEGTEVERAKRGILTDLWFASETSHGVAAELAWSAARLGDPDALAAFRLAIQRVTASDVQRVAQRWLDQAHAQLVVLDRGLGPTALKDVEPRPFRPPRAPRKVSDRGAAELHKIGGLRVALHLDDGPITAVRVLAHGGQLRETGRTAGLAEAWARTVVRAAGPWDPRALAAEADASALRLDAFAGRASQGLGASFPADQLAKGLFLVGEVVRAPHFAAEDWEHVQDTMLDDYAALPDDADTVAAEALWHGLWPKHPFRLPTLGNPSSLERLTPSRLRSFHQAAMGAEHTVVAVAGGGDARTVLQAIEAWLDGMPRQGEPLPTPACPESQASTRSRTAGSQQATVLLGVRSPPAHHPDRLALYLAARILDSQSGRLFLTLREQQGLAYSVWASAEANPVGGVFSVGLSTDPRRVAEAARGLKRELLRLAEDGPTAQELARTVRMVAGLAAMAHQRVTSRASNLARAILAGQEYGLPPLEAALAQVTPDQVRTALQRLQLGNALRVTVRPEEPADP